MPHLPASLTPAFLTARPHPPLSIPFLGNMADSKRSARAIVTYEAKDGRVNWKLEDITISRDIKPDEVLVRMVATGICHTDIVFSFMPAEAMGPYPKILGHEGSGYAEAVGSEVTHVKAGDPVLLSFASCASCKDCEAGHPSYCQQFGPVNYGGEQKLFSEASGQFFGQSSFVSLSVVNASSVVSAKGLVSDEELKMYSPMGCGFQTGVGTIDVLAEAKAEDTVVILGLGGVGLSGIMAAKMNNCQNIIGVDRFDQRLELAKSLGATHVVNTSQKDFDLTKAIKDLTDGLGADIVMDTTGNMGLINSGMDSTANRGQMIILGVPPVDGVVPVHLITFMQTGKRLRGSIEGDVTPSEYVPKMIKWQKEGKLPIEKLIKYYKAEEYEKALADMHDGSTIKPVLLW